MVRSAISRRPTLIGGLLREEAEVVTVRERGGESRDVEKTHRLLVVNRLALLREVIAKQLRLDHHEVVTAADSSEALALLKSGPAPCAILVDFLMPESGGMRLVSELRRDPRWARVPVVAMTGASANPGTEAATARIQKPFRIAELRDLLQRVCPGLAPPDRSAPGAA